MLQAMRVDSLPPGEYRLEIEVTDSTARQTVKAGVRFSLITPR